MHLEQEKAKNVQLNCCKAENEIFSKNLCSNSIKWTPKYLYKELWCISAVVGHQWLVYL